MDNGKIMNTRPQVANSMVTTGLDGSNVLAGSFPDFRRGFQLEKNTFGGRFDLPLKDAFNPAWGALYGVELDFDSPLSWRTLLHYRRLKPVSSRGAFKARLFLFSLLLISQPWRAQRTVFASPMVAKFTFITPSSLGCLRTVSPCCLTQSGILSESFTYRVFLQSALHSSRWDKWPTLQFTLRQHKQAERCSTS